MDDNAKQRRHNEPPSGTAPNPRYPALDLHAQRRSYGAGAGAGATADRFRPTSLNASPSATRSMGNTASYSGYYQEPASAFSAALPQSTIPYQSEYGHDNRQTQSFNAYNPSMIYSVPQTGTQSSVYDASPQFQSRQPAGLQMMPTDVSAPYFPSEPTNTTAASSLQPPSGSSSTPSVYQQTPADQRSLLQTYPSGMTSIGGMTQTNTPEQVMEEQQEYSASAEMGEAYEQYQSTLKEIFTNIKAGALQPASESLANVSEWLLTKASDLG